MRAIFSVIYLLSIVVFVILYFFLPDTYNKETEVAVLLYTMLLIFSFIYILKLRKSNNNRYGPIILFIVGFCVVFYQYYIDVVIGIKAPTDIAFLSSDLIVKSTLLSSIGLFSFFLGGTTVRQINTLKRKNDMSISYDVKPIRILYVISTILWLVFNAENCLSGTYSQEGLEQSAGTMSNYSNILYIMTFFSLLAFSAYNCIKSNNKSVGVFLKEIGVLPLLCVLIYVLLTMNLGDRGPIIIILSSILGISLIATEKKLSWFQLIVCMVVAASFFTLIGLARGLGGEMMYDKIRMVEARPDETCLPITAELASSQITLQYAIENVPDKYDFFYGEFQLRQLLATIPFSSRITSLFIDQDWRLRSSAFFMTYLIQGDYYTYGSGTSLIADLYMSFGIIGVILGMLWLGRIMMRNELRIDKKSDISLYVLLLYVCLCGYSVVESRSSLLSPLNFIAFSFITTYIVSRICKQRSLNNNG